MAVPAFIAARQADVAGLCQRAGARRLDLIGSAVRQPKARKYLWATAESASAVRRFVANKTLLKHPADEVLRSAVERQLIILGEIKASHSLRQPIFQLCAIPNEHTGQLPLVHKRLCNGGFQFGLKQRADGDRKRLQRCRSLYPTPHQVLDHG